jgi:multisubunit Na+/H+ antiporter MnhG subunit
MSSDPMSYLGVIYLISLCLILYGCFVAFGSQSILYKWDKSKFNNPASVVKTLGKSHIAIGLFIAFAGVLLHCEFIPPIALIFLCGPILIIVFATIKHINASHLKTENINNLN